MPPRIQPSGVQNRKRKRQQQELTQSLQGSLNKYLVKPESKANANENSVETIEQNNVEENNVEVNDGCENCVEVNDGCENCVEENNVDENLNENENENIRSPINDNNHSPVSENNQSPINEDDRFNCNIFDVRVCDSLSPNMKDLLVSKWPVRETNLIYPIDNSNRHFSDSYYVRTLRNNDTIDRKWLVYSKELDKVFCFCCKLFKTVICKSKLGNEGINNWRKLSEKLTKHESSSEHMKNLETWAELRLRLNMNQTIDKELQELIKKDTDHWKEVLVRIIATVKCLAVYNLPFRGTNEKLYENSNGNFLGILQMIAEFDPVMKQHFRRIENKETHIHYLSHKIQNELIEMLATEVKKSSPIKVEEFFLKFLVVEDTSGLGLFKVLLECLKSLDLDIKYVRGQGYDNRSNIKGKHSGVSTRLLEINPRAFYVSCGCHCLNLVLCDMANYCHKVKTFFRTCQTIYNVFSNSTKRWTVLLKYIDDLTLKSLSATRWESHVESVKAIITQIPQIKEALIQLCEVCEDGKVCRDAKSLIDGEFSSFEFILSLVIWYEILFKINLVSKKFQSKDMLLDVAIQSLDGLVSFFDDYRETGFDKAIIEAKKIAETIDVEPEFPVKRVSFDMTLSQLKTRFEQMKQFETIFDFMFDASKLYYLDDDLLKKSCLDLETALTYEKDSDIDGDDLFRELQSLQKMLPKVAYEGARPWTSLEIMEFTKKMDIFPNVLLAYKILLTVPVTVASAERSFSKLKLLKNYLRSTMTQERLNGLAIISIENRFLSNVDYDKLIEVFASKNARRHYF
ncbi:uncharacterized protein [Rutidosis leptorrhynchoides]|uniref:uncharacterized protein n=1 Tax=Rutidosis leptorrhynchoides TaxID=125765 RepID=UPI003A997F15